jgi:hypothetical protein
MICLPTLEGWAVQITRADGSWFFAAGKQGCLTPVWAVKSRKYAVEWATELKSHNFNARVVRVHYAHPVEIPPTKKRK